MNKIACGDCVHFDQQLKHRGNAQVNAWYGWCKKRSEYPAKEWDAARPFDVDVKRVAKGTATSNPFVVEPKGVLADCTDVIPKGDNK